MKQKYIKHDIEETEKESISILARDEMKIQVNT